MTQPGFKHMTSHFDVDAITTSPLECLKQVSKDTMYTEYVIHTFNNKKLRYIAGLCILSCEVLNIWKLDTTIIL